MAAELLVDELALIFSAPSERSTPTPLRRLRSGLPIFRHTALGIDLTGTSFISSAGLAVLLAAAERLEAGGGSLRLLGASETVVRLLELSGLAGRLPLADELGDNH